jgi:hypothetical protein
MITASGKKSKGVKKKTMSAECGSDELKTLGFQFIIPRSAFIVSFCGRFRSLYVRFWLL